MTIDELNNITKLTNRRKIEKALRAVGYFDCIKHKQIRHLSLLDLANGTTQNGVECLTDNGKQLFMGQIITQVNTAEQYEFIIVNILETPNNPSGRIRQTDILIWARAKNNQNGGIQ